MFKLQGLEGSIIALFSVVAFFSVMGFVGMELVEKFEAISSTYHAALAGAAQ